MHNKISARNFSRKTLNALTKRGVTLMRSVALPDANGSYFDSSLGFEIAHDGCGKVWRFLDVLAFAEGRWDGCTYNAKGAAHV